MKRYLTIDRGINSWEMWKMRPGCRLGTLNPRPSPLNPKLNVPSLQPGHLHGLVRGGACVRGPQHHQLAAAAAVPGLHLCRLASGACSTGMV